MQKRKNKKTPTEFDHLDIDNVASGMDCTGLIPATPENQAEAESYTDLYTIPEQGTIRDTENHIKREDRSKK